MHLHSRTTSRFARLLFAFGAVLLVTAMLVSARIATRASAAPVARYPNLKILPALDLRFDRADITPDLTGVFHNVLRFTNITENVGEGPLLVNAPIDPTTKAGPATQRVMNSDGTFTDIPLHTSIYWHEAHHHYHLDHWGKYQLWTKAMYTWWIASGRRSGRPSFTGSKTTSCISDEEFVSTRPRTPYPGAYGLSGCDVDGQGNIRMGLSPGWGDTYPYNRQDQWIDLNQSKLADGTYVLRSVADPNNILYESPNRAVTSRESVQANERATTFVVSRGKILDSTAPTASVTINHVDTVTNSLNVTLSVTGRDDVSGVNQFRVSNDNVHFTTFAYTAGFSVPTSVAWNLADPATGGTLAKGLRKVYAQVHDRSGKWSTSFTDTIDLEGNGPPPPPPSSYSQLVTSDAPAAYWRLDETSGSIALDTVGGHGGLYSDGVTLGVPSLLTDNDNAAQFSGTSQSVSVASVPSLAPATAVTVEAWIKPDALPATGTFTSIATKRESYSLQFNGPNLEFTIMQNGTRHRLQAAAGAIATGTAYYVAGTYDGTTQRFYINGTQTASVGLKGAITTNTNQFEIASWDGASQFFAGTVDEVAIYPRALSATQIAGHRTTGTASPPPQQIAASLTPGSRTAATTSSSPATRPPVDLVPIAATPVDGTAPVMTAYDSDLGQLYVSRNTSNGGPANGVTVIDAHSHAVLAQITTGRWAPGSIAVDPATHLVYVTSANYGDNTLGSGVAVIDGTTRSLTRRIAVGPAPKAVAVNPFTQRVYVVGQGGLDSSEELAVIDAATGHTITSVPIGPFDPYYDNPLGLTVNAATNTIYATNPLDGMLYAIDGATNTVVHRTPIGGLPAAVALDQSANTAYVADGNHGGSIDAVDGRTGMITDTIIVGTDIAGLAVDGQHNAVYATTRDGKVLVIDRSTGQIVQTVAITARLYGIAVDPTDGTVAVAEPIAADVRFLTRSATVNRA